jgi:hypothetical protein
MSPSRHATAILLRDKNGDGKRSGVERPSGVSIINGQYSELPKPREGSIYVRARRRAGDCDGFVRRPAIDLTLEVRPEFARTPDEAHRRIIRVRE